MIAENSTLLLIPGGREKSLMEKVKVKERNYLRKILLILTNITLISLCTLPVSAENIVSDTWSRFDRRISTFNPVGHYIKRSIEEAIPGLTFKGFLSQWTDFNVHNRNTVGFTKKDWDMQMSQNLFELELSYQINPKFELVNVYNFLYDAAYDWQHSEGLFAEKNDRDVNYYNNFDKRILRELYLKYESPHWHIRIGKQQVVWGKMDGQFIDIMNPMDRREFLQLEVDDFE